VRGQVLVDGAMASKPAQTIAAGAALALTDGAGRYVSRGAEKLLAGLDAFGFDPRDRVALDVGASTGGFTEVLLTRGAAKVYAVDVGRGQLHARLGRDARVVSLETTDARALSQAIIPEPIDVIVSDVSFISLTKALPAALQLATPTAWLIALIKPQFEVGPGHVGKGGIVRDDAMRARAVADIETWLTAGMGWTVAGVVPSPITGGDGNQEYLIGATRA
jgi:23S rRNA (cytidine1920-2'-O)/16S rRNA (cytidine1409-2'-O)-methyltransferase